MSHTHHDKKRLLARVRRIKGQVEAVERMLVEERDCYEVLQTIAACRGAIIGLTSEVLEGHVRAHIVERTKPQQDDLRKAGQEVIAVIKSFLK